LGEIFVQKALEMEDTLKIEDETRKNYEELLNCYRAKENLKKKENGENFFFFLINFFFKDQVSIKTNGTMNKSRDFSNKNKLQKFFSMKGKILGLIHVKNFTFQTFHKISKK